MITGPDTVDWFIAGNFTIHNVAGPTFLRPAHEYVVKPAIRLQFGYNIWIDIIPSNAGPVFTSHSPRVMENETLDGTGSKSRKHPDFLG